MVECDALNNNYWCQGLWAAGRGNTETVGKASSPPPIGCWLCCQPMPVLWFTNCDCRNGFVVPVGWGAKGPALVAGRGGCWAPKPLAKGFVPVAIGCSGGGLDWDGARAKGLVDVCCG